MKASNLIVTQVPLWTGATAAYQWSDFLAKRFTLADDFGVSYALYRKMNDMILLPRAVCPMGEDKRTIGLAIDCKSSFKPRTPAQGKAADEMVSLLKAGESFIFEGHTGSGKTVVACHGIAAIARTTLVVVTKTDLLNQWRAELKAILGLTDDEIGHIQGDKFDVAGKKVVIGMIHSLADYDKYPSWVLNYFGLTIFDETHRLSAPEFSKVAGAFSSRLRLGLSATPSRRDGKDPVFLSHIGPVRVRIKGDGLKFKVLVVKTAWECPRDRLGTQIPHGAGKDMHIKKIIAKNVTRNKSIVAVTVQAYNKGRNIVVFTDFINHAEMLQSMLYGAGVDSSDVGLYISQNTKKADALTKRIVIATWGMMSEGTDEPRLDTCVLTMPRGNVLQPVGRILRPLPDKKMPTVIDFVDEDSPVYKGYARARRSWYNRQGAEVVPVLLGE